MPLIDAGAELSKVTKKLLQQIPHLDSVQRSLQGETNPQSYSRKPWTVDIVECTEWTVDKLRVDTGQLTLWTVDTLNSGHC